LIEKSTMKNSVMTIVLVLGSFVSVLAQKAEVFSKDGYAIRGYDAVSYFTESKPVKGLPQFSLDWNGATWLFASSEHRELFKSNPSKYAPQYGGYCAYGLSRGYKAPTEANAFSIVNGKLYLNYNLDVRTEWNKDQKNYIEKADKNWPEVKAKG
jgi:YHS domain-containing protein